MRCHGANGNHIDKGAGDDGHDPYHNNASLEFARDFKKIDGSHVRKG